MCIDSSDKRATDIFRERRGCACRETGESSNIHKKRTCNSLKLELKRSRKEDIGSDAGRHSPTTAVSAHAVSRHSLARAEDVHQRAERVFA